MNWFGESWGAPCCEPATHIETPDGEACPGCNRSIRPGDQGVEIPFLSDDPRDPVILDWHLDCFLKDLGIKRAAT
jgi:hypothetical protein